MDGLDLSLNAQSSLKIVFEGKIIYFDPFKISEVVNDANYIFITHPHYDHFSEEDILKIKNDYTKIIAPIELKEGINKLGFLDQNILFVSPNNKYGLDSITFETVVAYNDNKNFHRKDSNWVGYILNLKDKRLYFAGDTDNVPEIRNISCDIACVPIGGTYTMNVDEAVELIKQIRPHTVIPMHYKTIVGSTNDAYEFREKLKDIAKVIVLME